MIKSASEDSRIPSFSFLSNNAEARALGVSIDNTAQQSLMTNTNFTLSQLPALKAILAELRPRLATLRAKSLAMDSARDERREERREYIEQRTRAHLERNGQAIPANGSILPEKKLDIEEIEALEKVASMFGPS